MTRCFVRTAGHWPQILLAVCILGALAPCTTSAPAPVAPQPAMAGVKVGTFHRGNLVMAFYRSAYWEGKMSGLMEQRSKASTSGDLATVEKIEADIRAMQQMAEKQLKGREPIANILEQLRPQWPDIAKEAGVQLIIEDQLYLAPNTPLVDITTQVLKRFPPKGRAPQS
jgi:hypothetical protein